MLVFVSVADSKDGVVERRGPCNKGSKWKLKLRPQGSSFIEVDFDAENYALRKQNWKIEIMNNNKTVYKKTLAAGTSIGDDSNDDDSNDDNNDDSTDDTTDDSVYVFEISTIIGRNKIKNNVVARAKSSKTNETCIGKGTL
jgi:hypothetical protein